jgi:hypothetical protein
MTGQRLLHPISWEIATLPTVFTTPRLAIRIDKTRSTPDSWHRAGFIYPVISIDNQDYEGSSIPINFGGTIIDIPFREYRIKFSPVEWLDKSQNLYLRIFELDTNMGINAASNTPPPIGNEVITAIPTTTTPTILRPLNPVFASGYIVNNSSRTLYVSFTDAPAITAASPNSAVPSKGNIEIPENYTGLIQGIWANADANGKAEIHQVNYI